MNKPFESAVAPDEHVPLGGIGGFIAKFTVLKGAQRELWITFLIKLLMISAYSVTNKTLVLWLSSDLRFSDQAAGALVGWGWASAMTVFTLLAGSLTDAIGLRRTFFLGVGICTIARAVMVFTTYRWLALACGLFPLAIGEALSTPVLLAATRRYSTTAQRSISFSLIYGIMNAGFLVGAPIFDYFRKTFGEHGHVNLFGLEISTYRTLLFVALGFEVLLFPVVYFLRKGAEATDEGVRFNAEPSKYATAAFWNRILLTVRDSARDTVQLFSRLLSQSVFYRFVAFFVLIGFLKLIYVQMDYVFPKFAIRELGEGAPAGRLSMINYLLIVLLVPITGALMQRFSAYRMVVIGGTVCAASVFIMALPTNWFQDWTGGAVAQWFGHSYLGLNGAIHPYYIMSGIQISLFSVGEALYSPRVYEYAAAIAPKGQEASYGALSYIPLYIGKLLVGATGFLLAAFCPEQGPRHSGIMWFIFACAATVAPVGLLVFRRYIQVHEAGRAD